MNIGIEFKLRHLIIIALLPFLMCSCGIRNVTNSVAESFDEPEAPQLVTTVQNWEGVKSGLQIGWGSSNRRYHREYIPEVSSNDIITCTGWKNERVSLQAVLWSNDEVENITVEVKDLKAKNERIESGVVDHYIVRNVLADEFLGGCGYKTKTQETAHLVADCLEKVESFNLEEKSTRGIWFNIDIPADAKSGKYIGHVIIHADGKQKKTLEIVLNVLDRILPSPENWEYHLDLWQNPFAVARVHNVKLWSEDHFGLMKPLYKMLAQAGQKCITASILHHPWGGQTLDHFESMIKHVLKSDGTWTFDYSIFDQWINFMMETGIKQQINCYSMIPWGNQLTYFDESIQRDTFMVAPATSREFVDYWVPFLKDFKRHLEDKKWMDITTIAMDERPVKYMKKAIQLIQEYAGLKITSAANYNPELSNMIYDLSVESRHILPDEVREQRRDEGQITTYYVCCSAEYPNNFTYSPPIEGVWQGWYAYAQNLDGFLRWAYNSWVEEPLIDTRFRTWPAGDTFFVYPGAKSSVRFEKLREGIQDFEKLRIIEKELKESGTDQAKTMLLEIQEALSRFTIESIKKDQALSSVLKAKELINSLY